MYQVITMYGENEPWWFFDDWKKDIQTETIFEIFEEAVAAYEEAWQNLVNQYTHINARSNYMCAFWNEGDKHWCVDCDDDLQNYMGLALLKDYQPMTRKSRKELYETTNSSGETKCCKRPK